MPARALRLYLAVVEGALRNYVRKKEMPARALRRNAENVAKAVVDFLGQKEGNARKGIKTAILQSDHLL